MSKPRIAIVGTGYVGLVAAAVFADRGFSVLTSSQSRQKVEAINKGKAPFFEEGLDAIVAKTVREGNLKAVVGRREAVLKSDIFFIAVGTPSLMSGEADLRLIRDTATAIGEALRDKETYCVVVARSTIVPGTTRNVIIPLLEQHSGKKAGVDFGVCMSPEFLRQGTALQDTSNPDSVVIGELDERSGSTLEEFCAGVYAGQDVPFLRMNLESAEMVKYGRNTFLAMNISYINEMARIAEAIPGIDIYEVVKGVGADWRINPAFLNAGCGYGGSCFPKDVKALISFARLRRVAPSLLETVEEVNEQQAAHTVRLARQEVGNLKGKRIAILGLAFKPGTDDMREAPAIKIANHLYSQEADVVAYDPKAIPNARDRFIRDTISISYADSVEACLKDADCCLILTEWDAFKALKSEVFNRCMKRSVVIDARRICGPEVREGVAVYRGIGLGQDNAFDEDSGLLKLGERLIQGGLLNEAQLEKALGEQKRSGGLIGTNLIKLGFITEEALLDFLSREYGIPTRSS